jgi:L-amino acid N-acyltransferase YncA
MVRPAVPADFAAITAIYAEAVLNGVATWETEAPDAAEMLRRHQAIAGNGYPWLVAATGDGTLAGYAYASSYRPRAAYRFTVENSIYIDRGAQRRGVGRLLLQGLITACEAQGFRQMVAVIGDSANEASIGLHKALGFEQVGTVPSVGFKHGRWLDQVLMARPLGHGNRTSPV